MSEITKSNELKNHNQDQTIIVNQQKSQPNIPGIVGFILALIGFFLVWIPLYGFILWILGLILSFVGIFKKPKGFAIAGLIISLIGLIFMVLLFIGIVILGSALSF